MATLSRESTWQAGFNCHISRTRESGNPRAPSQMPIEPAPATRKNMRAYPLSHLKTAFHAVADGLSEATSSSRIDHRRNWFGRDSFQQQKLKMWKLEKIKITSRIYKSLQ